MKLNLEEAHFFRYDNNQKITVTNNIHQGEDNMIIAFIIWTIVAILFMGIGIRAGKTKEPAGFFTFVDPPKVTDVKGYNHAVSVLWIVAAAIFELMGIPFLFLKQNSPMAFLIVFGVVVLIVGMMIAYSRIEDKYRA